MTQKRISLHSADFIADIHSMIRRNQWLSCIVKSGPAALITASIALVIGCGGGGGGTSVVQSQTPGSQGSTGASTGASAGTSSGTTTGTGTSTGSGKTTGSTTTGGTTGGSTSNPAGFLTPNTIYYADNLYTTEVLRSISPDGSNALTIGSLPSGFGAAVVNPSSSGSYVFSAAPGSGASGIYSSSQVSLTGATTIVSPQYDDVSMLEVTPDGTTLVYVGSVGGVSSLYQVPMAGGTPHMLTVADSAALSPDGSTLVYSAPTQTGEMIGTMSISGSEAKALTDGAAVDLYPQFSKDGTRVVFSSNRDGGASSTPFDLYSIQLSSNAITRLTNSPDSSEFGASFNDAGTAISFISIAPGQAGATGVYVANIDGAGLTEIWPSDSVGDATYWSSQNGRSRLGSRMLFQRIKRRS